jgi:hypothetical protein
VFRVSKAPTDEELASAVLETGEKEETPAAPVAYADRC